MQQPKQHRAQAPASTPASAESKKRAAEDDCKTAQKRSKSDASAKAHDTPSKNAKVVLTPALLKAAAEHLTKKNKPMTFSDMIKYLTQEKGLNKREVKKFLLKKVHPSLDTDGRLILA